MLIFKQKSFYFCTPNLETPQPVLPCSVYRNYVAKCFEIFKMCFQCDIGRKRTQVYRKEIRKNFHDKVFLANWQC